MANQRIGLIGISMLNAGVGPDGNHLRWTFPREAGFPPRGFLVFRRETKKFSETPLSFSALPVNVDLPDDLVIGGVQLSAHPVGRHLRCVQSGQTRTLQVSPSTSAQVELRFFEPVVHLRLELGGSGVGALRAFSGKRLVAQVTSGGAVRELFSQGADRAVLDLGPGAIRTISFTTQSTACNLNDWRLLKKLPLPNTDNEARNLLEAGLRNHYAPELSTARVRYRHSADQIVIWLKRLLAPTPEFFTNPNVAPHLLQVKSDVEGPTTATYPQSLLFLAALDPNVARMMCLYWVDAFEPTSRAELPPPNRQSFYDYKVEGDWNDGDARCGLLLNLGQPPAPLPALQPSVTGKQLEGVRWLNREMLGRIGLTWPKPAFDAGTPQAGAVQPVLYEITRISEGREAQIREPILVDSRSWEKEDPVLFIDRDLRAGFYKYKVRPIDLFGQIGAPLQSDLIEVADDLAPPPPVRTRNHLQQTGEPARLSVQFEFGATQHEQAPDVKEFQPYWRADTLLARRNLRVDLTATEPHEELLVHTVRIRNVNSSSIPFNELETFAGDVITNVISSAGTIPIENRRRFRIDRAVAPDKVILEPSAHAIANGTYELVRDPHNKTAWNRLPQKISWREPISGLLRLGAADLRVEALAVERKLPRPDPFASIPPEARARNHPELPPAPEVLEIVIDRVLTEPDTFARGHARVTGSSSEFELLYVVTNLAEMRTTIAVPATATIVTGNTLILSPPSSMAHTVKVIQIDGTVDGDRLLTSGGEVAFESSVAKVISNPVNRSGVFELVVRAEDAQSIASLRLNQSRVRYYAPFVLTVDIAASTNVPAPISLPINPAAGRRDGFINVSSIDVEDREGPLGTASQFTLTLPGPTGAPSRPYPCGMDVTAAAGYASPPNIAGRSTICVAWDLNSLSPTEGLRYEVARALDNGILAAHLSSWQLGKNDADVAPVIAGSAVNGTLEGIQPTDGLIRVQFKTTTPVADAATFRNGRLVQGGVYYKVTLASGSEKTIDLLLRGGPSPLSSGPATLEAPPDYSAVKSDDAALQALALDTPDAFALVTGVPVDTNKFVDDVAGKGQNRFFYKVRAVDAAENRSSWSPISKPFHQVDTSAPLAPAQLIAVSGIRSVILRWTLDPAVDSYAVHRATSIGALSNVRNLPPHAVVNAASTAEAPLEVVYNDPTEIRGSDSSYWYRVVAQKNVQLGPTETDHVTISSGPSEIVRATPVDPDPPSAPLDLVAIRSLENGLPVVRLTWSTTASLEVLVRRRLGSSSMWIVVSDWANNSGTQTGASWNYNFLDASPLPEPSVYQVLVKNHAGRTAESNQTDPV